MQPRNERFLALFRMAASNVVESTALLMEFVAAPHERWAELANVSATGFYGGQRTRHPARRSDSASEVRARIGWARSSPKSGQEFAIVIV